MTYRRIIMSLEANRLRLCSKVYGRLFATRSTSHGVPNFAFSILQEDSQEVQVEKGHHFLTVVALLALPDTLKSEHRHERTRTDTGTLA
jgi:hypothetical protein